LAQIQKYLQITLFFLLVNFQLQAQNQQADRLKTIETKLDELANSSLPGLKEVVDFSVSGVSIQEFLRGLAETNNLNISIDPTLNIKVVNNFTNEKVASILLFLCKEYGLEMDVVGSIMSFKKFEPAPIIAEKPKPKDLHVVYNAYNDQLSLDLQNDSLAKVSKRITQVTKKNLILASGLSSKLISVYIENMPFDNAIDKMAFVNNLKLIKTKDNFYLLESAEQNPNNTSSSGNGNSSNNQRKNYLNNSNNKESNVDNLNFEVINDSINKKVSINIDAVNVSIADIIKSVAKESKVNYFMFSDPKGNTTSKIHGVNFEEMLSYLLQGTEHTFKKENNVYLIGERALEGLRTSKVVQLQHRSAEVILENIPADLKKGVEVKYFKELNALLISGSEIRGQEIEAFVKQLDRVVPMITIEVILVTVSKTRLTKTGLAAGLDSTQQKSKGTIFPGFDFTFNSKSVNQLLGLLPSNSVFNIGKVTPNFYVSLSALESQGDINVESTPKLSTLNGHEANLKIGSTRYYELSTQNTIGSLTTNVVRTQQFNQVQANLSIKINPSVSGDDQVTLDIDVENTDFTEIPPSGPPPTSTSSFKSMIRVKNDEMVVLGGLEKSEKRDQGSGVPLLSRIPVLKWIFSSRTRTKTKSKQLVFIRPTIIY